jgi:septum formation protein
MVPHDRRSSLKPIILGSSSPRRLQLMQTIDPDVEQMIPDIDEKAIRHLSPQALTAAIALAKSRKLRPLIQDDKILVTADSVTVCGGELREKPETEAQAREFLRSYRKLPVSCVTSVVVYRTGTVREILVTDQATVKFMPFSAAQVNAIIAEASIFTSAGGFFIEHPLFADHVEWTEGDPETIMGLPTRLVRVMLEDIQR